jgi:hypothetical protein
MKKELSAWEKYKQNLGDTRPWDMLNPSENYGSEQLATERYSICLACPELISLTKQCKKCGCFMAAKTKLEKASCPIGKW